MQFTNKADLPFGLALWCASDEYNFKPSRRSISATSLIKPMRQILLSRKYPELSNKVDLIDKFASRRGTAIHDSIEKSFHNKDLLCDIVKYFGFNVDSVFLNPNMPFYLNVLKNNNKSFTIFTEKRFEKTIELENNDSWNISGQLDLVLNGALHDYKTTSVYTYINDSKANDYILQGSIYRFLAPEIVLCDAIVINYIFTDWNKKKVDTNPNYPKYPMLAKCYPLMSIDDTYLYLKNRLIKIKEYENTGELPLCNDDDLWIIKPVYKYYTEAGKKCMKKFDDIIEASKYVIEKGKGFVVKEEASPKRCLYCNMFDVCEQKDKYFPNGKVE